jgi:hypothetical protein
VRNLRHPATIVAAIALFVALGGGAAASASWLIAGWKIKNHSISAEKLTKSAVKSLRGKRGARGPAGAAGADGAQGPAGADGPQGPGGKIVTFDATATSTTPTATTLGTFLGDTLSPACASDGAGGAVLTMNFSTSDGGWIADVSDIEADSSGASSTSTNSINIPAGTITSTLPLNLVSAVAGNHTENIQGDFVQTSPSPGSMIWHATATTDTKSPTCHFSIQYFPETISAVHGAAHTTTSLSQLPFAVGH